MDDFIFNQVVITSGDKAGTKYTPKEFVGMPVIQRVGFIVSKSAQFLFNGKEVNRTEALNQIRARSMKK